MKSIIYAFLLLFIIKVNAQVNVTYQKPSKEILDLVDVPLAPSVIMDANKSIMVFLYRDAFKTIAELSEDDKKEN